MLAARRICSLLSIAVLAVSPAFADHHNEADTVLKKLQGVWEIEEGVNQGTELSEDDLEGTTMVVKDRTIVTFDKDKKETYRATFTLDVTKTPIQIDLTTEMKNVPKSKAMGIVKFEEDDEFELAYALPGANRPKEFESPKDSKIMLFELEKEE